MISVIGSLSAAAIVVAAVAAAAIIFAAGRADVFSAIGNLFFIVQLCQQ